MVPSTDGDTNFLDTVAGILQRDMFEPFPFIIYEHQFIW